MMYLVTYDISDDRLRSKVIKLITAQGYERIQYSVFSGLIDPRRDEKLWSLLEELGKKGEGETFKIFVIPVADRDFLSMGIIGKVSEDMDYLMGRTNTLII